MTENEARVVCHLIATADNGCPNCVINLAEKFHELFPQFKPKQISKWLHEENDIYTEAEYLESFTP